MEVGSIYGVVLQSCFKRLCHWFTLCANKKDQMPSKKTVDNCGFSCLGYDIGNNGEVTLIWCKTCREFFHSESKNVAQAKGVAAIGSEVFIKGTATP